MKRKPPYYTVDTQTRQFLELVASWAKQLDAVQQAPTEIAQVVDLVCERFGLELEQPHKDLAPNSAEVVQLRPFRVITTNTSETEDEPR